jgi:hypothetical protein
VRRRSAGEVNEAGKPVLVVWLLYLYVKDRPCCATRLFLHSSHSNRRGPILSVGSGHAHISCDRCAVMATQRGRLPGGTSSMPKSPATTGSTLVSER